jgi:acetoin utilization deacetylase AcuC-like enzyme
MELMFNRMVPMFDRPERMDQILERLRECGYADLREPQVFGLDPIHRIHDPEFVAFLVCAYERWTREVAGGGFATAYMFAMRGMRHRPGKSIHALLSFYTFDVCVPFVEGTWKAIKSSVDTVLTAQMLVAEGAPCAFALCRPPGHHASQDLAGGYCYLNNAAIAAQAFLDQGAARVAILDVDYHHGNGTQRIFYERADVLYVSVHGAPEEEYPFLVGYADERGAGPGEGHNINLPLPKGSAWPVYCEALQRGLAEIRRYSPDVLIVSLGVDTYKGDPVSAFALESDDFLKLGEVIARIGKPTLLVMEGGYEIEALGLNVVNALVGFEARYAKGRS